MRVNTKVTSKDESSRLAGEYGVLAAKQNPEGLLRRSVMANLLWENLFYEDGQSVVDNIKNLIPQVEPQKVFDIAIEARTKQKLRHAPLLIAREMARYNSHKNLVGKLLPKIILRADEITEFVALYWQDGKQPLSKQVKKGLAAAFNNFDAYQFAKYNRQTEIKLRDVMFLVHPKPAQMKAVLFKQLANNTLPIPDTWEVSLSTGKDKRETWEHLIRNKKMGALAFVRNLRNMEQVELPKSTIEYGFETINPRWLLPLNYLAAAKHAPYWEQRLEALMLRGLANVPKLKGKSIFIVDVSGSMNAPISNKSQFDRLEVAAAMTILAKEMCEDISIYATAGNDYAREHQTIIIPNRYGFELSKLVYKSRKELGGGGIFTRQCLEYIQEQEHNQPDRIIIFSDSQDCDFAGSQTPSPFGRKNYIIDVSAHSRGINYAGLWTAEISGWSEHFLTYITALEN